MSTYKFGTIYGLTRDEIIEKMQGMIDYEEFIRCDFDYSRYHWVIGGAVAAVMKIRLPYAIKSQTRRNQIEEQLANSKYGIACVDATEKNFMQNPISILGVDVKTIEWDPRKINSIFLNINDSEPKPRRVNYADCFNKHPVGKVEIIPKKVIFNDPATIVFWCDGSKTVVKAEGEPFDPEKGLAMAYAKKASGNTGSYYNEFKKWLPKKKAEYHRIIGGAVAIEETNPKLCCDCKHKKLPTTVEPCHSCIGDDSKINWVKADE